MKVSAKKNKRGKDYKKREYKNPLFTHRKKKLKLSFLVSIVIFLIVIFLIVGAWFLLASKYFKINSIEVIGGISRIKSDAVNSAHELMASKKFLVLKQDNIFLFDSGALREKISSEYMLSFITVNKKFPNSLIIEFKQKEFALIWQEDGVYYFIDKEGGIIEEANPINLKNNTIPIVINQTESTMHDKKIENRKEAIDFILNISESLAHAPWKTFNIIDYAVKDSFNFLSVKTIEGPELYFNYTASPVQQVDKLKTVLQTKIKNDFSKKIYIDLRFKDMVYVK
jgi:hypothetical protein